MCVRIIGLPSISRPIRRRLANAISSRLLRNGFRRHSPFLDRLGISYFFDFVSLGRSFFPITKRRAPNLFGLLLKVKRRPKLAATLSEVQMLRNPNISKNLPNHANPSPSKKGSSYYKNRHMVGLVGLSRTMAHRPDISVAFQKVLNVKKSGALTEPSRPLISCRAKREFHCNGKYNWSIPPIPFVYNDAHTQHFGATSKSTKY